MSYIFTADNTGTYEFTKIDGQLVSMPTDGYNKWCLIKTPDNIYSWSPTTEEGGTGTCGCINKVESYECSGNTFECDVDSVMKLIIIDLEINDLMTFCNNEKPLLTCSVHNESGMITFYNKCINCLTNTHTVVVPFFNSMEGECNIKCAISSEENAMHSRNSEAVVVFSKVCLVW